MKGEDGCVSLSPETGWGTHAVDDGCRYERDCRIPVNSKPKALDMY